MLFLCYKQWNINNEYKNVVIKWCVNFYDLSSKWKCLEYAGNFSINKNLIWDYDDRFQECIWTKNETTVVEKILIDNIEKSCYSAWKEQIQNNKNFKY